MKKINILFSAAIVALFVSSCTVTEPLSVSAAPLGNKTGVSSTAIVFGFRTNKSFGIGEAAHNGKITGGVGAADIKTTNYFLFTKKQIIVYGN